MLYTELKHSFDTWYDSFKLPSDCSELTAPTFALTVPSSPFFWTFEWVLGFEDNNYLRLWEHYRKTKGLFESYRAQFAYHYGPHPAGRINDPLEIKPNDPVDIRIDNFQGKAHMHLGAPNPHYFQERVDGLQLERVEIQGFVHVVMDHRSTGKPFARLLGFTVK